jgi:hypothetical protein
MSSPELPSGNLLRGFDGDFVTKLLEAPDVLAG